MSLLRRREREKAALRPEAMRAVRWMRVVLVSPGALRHNREMKFSAPALRLLPVAALLLILAATGCGKKGEAAKSQSSSSDPAVAPPQGAVELKLKLPVGARFPMRIEVVQKSEMRIPSMPKPMQQETTLNQELRFTVLKEYEGGGREVELEFSDVDMSVMVNGREAMAFDSRGESLGGQDNPAASAFQRMVGAKLKYVLDESNQVAKVEGWSELVTKMFANSPGARMMAGVFTEDYFKQLADFSQGLPGKAVQPGDTWPVKRTTVMGPLGEATLDLTYTFKNWELREKRQCARMEFSGPIRAGAPSTNSVMMGIRMAILHGTTSGQSWFDPELGLTIDADVGQKMNVLMSFPGTNAPARGANPSGSMTNVMGQRIRLRLLSDEK